MIKQVFRKFNRLMLKLIVLGVLLPQSWWVGFKSLSKPDKIVVEKDYKGQKILLIALYEKGKLRNDIKRLLKTAKRLGYYTLGVNTSSLTEDVSELLDCYIERFNFGRDFGSYKAGFNYIFNKKLHLQCPRLLMINDSVYYESTRTEKFLLDLMNTDIEVLGATENHQIEHHLGSFCISMSNRILKHEKFIHYWQSYKNSELRPVVIKNGEAALSVCLKRLVSQPVHFRALYDVELLSKLLKENEQNIKAAILLARDGRPEMPWVRLEIKRCWLEFVSKKYLSKFDFGFDHPKKTSMEEYRSVYDVASMEQFFNHDLKIKDDVLHNKISSMLRSRIIEAFRVGSQIHQFNAFLLYIGLPIIKLDGFFRGVFVVEDIFNITNQMQAQEAQEIEYLLLSKSYGGDSLLGWKKILFSFGFL